MVKKLNLIVERIVEIQLVLSVLVLLCVGLAAIGFIPFSFPESLSRDGLFLLGFGFLFLPLYAGKYKYMTLIFTFIMIVSGVLMLTGILPKSLEELPVFLILLIVIGIALVGIERFRRVFSKD